ncbi:hypothetical protein C0989_006230 [Termitomyces sp. Mn162]|nr:hypothetical protein C0989_006230 [Termitomyces sp. Mn162]
MTQHRDRPIEISSSPEPVPIQTRARTKPNPAVPVIELSDSDDGQLPVRVCHKPAPNAIAGPSSRRRPQKLGSSSSVQNIPKKPIPARAVPLFLPSDEENDPPTAQPRTLTPAPFPFVLDAPPEPVVDLVNEPEPDPDPHSTVTARVLEIVPDVEPDYLLATVTKHMLDHPDQDTATVIEFILHALFEDDKYPKVDRLAKGKRKQPEHQQEEARDIPTKKSKIDYADKNRPFKGGQHYTDLALEHLQTTFQFIPKPYLRQVLTTHKGLYAPAHLFLAEQEKSHEKQREAGQRIRLPYSKRSTPYRPKGKGAAAQDEELDAERKWLLEHLQGNEAEEMAEEDEEDDGSCEDGIECGCCFSTYRFDKMIQCPETHLFCMTCMRSYASTLLGTHDPNIKCMDQSGCKALIPPSELKRFLPEKLMTLYERVKQRKEVEAAGLEGLEECPFCEWGIICRKVVKIIKGYDHFNPEPKRAATSNNPNAGKCLLWDSVEQRHADEVKAAAERAQAEYKRDNPDVADEAIKVDLPVAPPPPANGPGAIQAQLLRNAQAALERAQADLAARQAEERAHYTAMNNIYAELQYLEELRKVPGMQAEYDRQAGPKRTDYSRENARFIINISTRESRDSIDATRLHRHRVTKMIIFTVLSTVFSFFVVYDKVNLRNPHHRSLIAKGTLAIVVEEVVDWFHPILYHETDPGTDLILAPAFALALLPVPPEVCGLDEAPIPGTDLIVAPVFALSTLPAPPEAPGPLSFLDSLDMLFSVVPYNHNSILPASLPQPSSTVTPSTHRTTLGFICLPALVILVSLLCLRFNGITKGHHTLYENAEYSESTVRPPHPHLSIAIANLSLQGEVFVWSQSDVGCTVSAAPSLNAFQLIDRDVNLSSDITLGFQFSAEAEQNTVTDAEDVSSEVTPGSDGLNSTTTVTDNGDEDLSNATTPDSSDEEVNAATDAEDISSSCAFEQNNIDPLYSVTDMLLTTLIPSLNESLDAYVSCEEALAAKIASFLRMLLPEEDSTYDVPYWVSSSQHVLLVAIAYVPALRRSSRSLMLSVRK